MHNLMRDFCIDKAREENFFQVIQNHNVKEVGSSSNHSNDLTVRSRRVAIHGRCDFDRYKVQLHLRSFLCFDSNPFPVSSFRGRNFMLLGTLKLRGSNLRGTLEILEQICKLIQLRYLGLRGTFTLKLPNSIDKLRSLRTSG